MKNLQQVYWVHKETSALEEEMAAFKRRRIKETAWHMFFRDCYEATTVARQLDFIKLFIHSYLKNKSEFLYEICKTSVSLPLKAGKDIQKIPNTPLEKLQSLVHEIIRIAITHQQYIVVYERSPPPATRARRTLYESNIAFVITVFASFYRKVPTMASLPSRCRS